MPDVNGGRWISLQCLNVWHSPQDATFLGLDLPGVLSRSLRVAPPGPAWGVAGYSEGGYCAADLALRYPARYGAAGVLSGYFVPGDDRLGSPPRTVNPFGPHPARRALNTPVQRVTALPVSEPVPQFWLGAGGAFRVDVAAAQAFQRRLLDRQPSVALHLAPGGKHNMATWRALVPPMLAWMTPRLAGPPPGSARRAVLGGRQPWASLLSAGRPAAG